MKPPDITAGMTCEAAALALLVHPDDDSVRRAKRHQQQCTHCNLGADADVESPVPAIQSSEIPGMAIPGPPTLIIAALALVGTAQLAITAPWLVAIDPLDLLGQDVVPAHQVRDGAFGVIITTAALLTVRRPRWAQPAFIISAIALVIQTAASLVDNTLTATGANETVHFLAVLTTVLTGLTAVRLATLGPTRPKAFRSVRSPPGSDCHAIGRDQVQAIREANSAEGELHQS